MWKKTYTSDVRNVSWVEEIGNVISFRFQEGVPRGGVGRDPGETYQTSDPASGVAGMTSAALCGTKTSHKSTQLHGEGTV